ncbi:UvrD-helicase domain-containing protein [Catellatospora sp. KI3]|uniref:UvrD-helicase domain-containing protein n=1 Tax=Catellatospora sp. KI3 TaxID=3041620 RepID=UPI0024831A10|nr:UvrD-helicase domain-containing protein [Catellatospora sp. KI3]MDI1463436.1 UvrD-helicase domain-containing protein [Catellatospora sp. KI3]
MEAIKTTWGRIGRRGSRDWRLDLVGGQLVLTLPDRTLTLGPGAADEVRVVRRWLRYVVQVQLGSDMRTLTGIGRRPAERLQTFLAAWAQVAAITAWARQVLAVAGRAESDGRWITIETIRQLVDSRPRGDTGRGPVDTVWGLLGEVEQEAVRLWRLDLVRWSVEVNQRVLRAELTARGDLFQRVETTPLTFEQACAVVCMDNRVSVVAAAGSGKTSVMVARTAYAIARGFVAPERILLLAFNQDAAKELQQRLQRRLAAVGVSADGVTASTFHAFGLSVIGQVTGRKPRVASWVDGGQGQDKILRIVDRLRDSSERFRYAYDTYRLLYARTSDNPKGTDGDIWHRDTRSARHRTFSGHLVRSQGEKIIADFLYLNGVDFAYERPFTIDTATAEHGQYHPDFYYPAVDVWHEHWALDAQGRPPADFHGYAEGMAWKRQLHQDAGTQLIETTWASIMGADGLVAFGAQLTAAGLTLEWNPDRPSADRDAVPASHEDMARLLRTFMAHVKAGDLTEEAVEAKLRASPGLNTARTRHFLSVYWPVHRAWQQALTDEGAVDFEDMLVTAGQMLETRAAQLPYDMVLVDEFQDTSQARARIVRALVDQPGKYLLTVGDDWQAINRFAGADITIMREYRHWFGPGPMLRLTTTFRCTQEICDVSSAFVAKNDRQIGKTVTASAGPGGDRVRLRYSASNTVTAVRAAVAAELDRISESDQSPGNGTRPASVLILGRYRHDDRFVPAQLPAGLTVTFKTVHGAKGLEADYVIVANMTRGRLGFPSEVADDPVLNLAMAAPDPYPHAEERRLFYVALTRARHQVVLISVRERESVFVAELLNEGKLEPVEVDATSGDLVASTVQACARCGLGVMVQRVSAHGPFLTCSTFPDCRATINIPQQRSKPVRPSSRRR